MALNLGSIVLHRLIKGNVKNLQVSDSGPQWPSCFQDVWKKYNFMHFEGQNVFRLK